MYDISVREARAQEIRQSLCYWHTQGMDANDGSDQNLPPPQLCPIRRYGRLLICDKYQKTHCSRDPGIDQASRHCQSN